MAADASGQSVSQDDSQADSQAALDRLRDPDTWTAYHSWGRTKASARVAEFLDNPERSYLVLSDCGYLGALPDELRFLAPRLRSLNVSTNALRAIPAWIGELENLERLDICDNAMTSEAVSAIGGLTNLKYLDCGDVTMAGGRFPSWLRGLTRLRQLTCSACKLEELPDWICELEDLEHLDCNSNKLTALPTALGRCEMLITLRCENWSFADPWKSLMVPHTETAPEPNQDAILSHLREIASTRRVKSASKT